MYLTINPLYTKIFFQSVVFYSLNITSLKIAINLYWDFFNKIILKQKTQHVNKKVNKLIGIIIYIYTSKDQNKFWVNIA